MVKQSVLNIKVKREIKSNWKQYLSVVIIAMLAVTLFTGILANYRNFQDKLKDIYDKTNMCDGIIMTREYNEQMEQYLINQNIEYQKRIYFPTKFENNPIYLITFKNDDTMNMPYEASASETIQVLVDENFLTRYHLEVGQDFSISFPFSLFGKEYVVQPHLRISGTMVHPESLENTSANPPLVYVNYEYLQQMIFEALPENLKTNVMQDFVRTTLNNVNNQFLIKSDNPELTMNMVNLAFTDSSNFLYALETKNLPSNMAIEADVIQAKKLLYIFPIIFYLVALLIILTSISQLINREQKNIGLLKALGYTKWEILRHYIKIFIVLGLIGACFGILLGPLIIPQVMNMKYNILYQLPKVSSRFFRLEYLISVVILLCIIIITSIFACFDATSMVPAESLRGENSVKLKLSFLAKFKIFKKIPLSFLMAFRNMKRKVSRTIMVIVGVLGCSSLLACGFGIENTIHYGLDLEFDELIPYDISVTYTDNMSYRESIQNIDGVIEIDEYAKYNVNIGKIGKVISSFVYVLPTQSNVFSLDYDEHSCFISSKVAEKIDCKVGDEVSFMYQNQEYKVVITEIVDFCISQGIFISCDYSFPNALEFKPSGAWVRTTDRSVNENIVDTINAVEGITSSMSMDTMRKRADETITSIKVMTMTIKIFAILLAIVVLYNLALLNFKERTKDIATLKVLGFSKFEIGSSFIIEILFLTFVGAILGLFFGKPLLIAVLSINENPILSYIYYIKPLSYIWTILLTCGTSLVINIIFAFLTNKVKMVESLKSVE